MPVNGRQKGHSYERAIAEKFRKAGYQCVTSRMESKAEDDRGGDLVIEDCRWQVQCKAVETLGSAHNTLAKMQPTKNRIPIVFHKRNRQGTVVSMKEEDFWKLEAMLRNVS